MPSACFWLLKSTKFIFLPSSQLLEPWILKSQNERFFKLNKKYLKNLVSMLYLKEIATQSFMKTLLKKVNKKEKMLKNFYFCRFPTHKHLNLVKHILDIALFTFSSPKPWNKTHRSTETRWKKLHSLFTTYTKKKKSKLSTKKAVHAECQK